MFKTRIVVLLLGASPSSFLPQLPARNRPRPADLPGDDVVLAAVERMI